MNQDKNCVKCYDLSVCKCTYCKAGGCPADWKCCGGTNSPVREPVKIIMGNRKQRKQIIKEHAKKLKSQKKHMESVNRRKRKKGVNKPNLVSK